jgi:hypothetical protein
MFNDKRIVISETKISEEIIRERLTITVKLEKDLLYAYGDTYHIKDDLKKLGFRWDATKKAWYMKLSEEPIDVIVNTLKSLGVNVVVVNGVRG